MTSPEEPTTTAPRVRPYAGRCRSVARRHPDHDATRARRGRTRASTLLVVALFAISPLIAGCTTQSASSLHARAMVLGEPDRAGLSDWPSTFNSPVAAADLNGDGWAEIVAHDDRATVYVFDVRSGEALGVVQTKLPTSWRIDQVQNPATVAELAPGEGHSLVIANHAAYVSVVDVEPDGRGGIDLTTRWEQRMTQCNRSPSMDGAATVGDLTGDGRLEIVVQNEEQGLFALDADGNVLWQHCWAGGNASPVVADLDGDGRNEAVFASDSGFIAVIGGASGDPLWTFNAADDRYGVDPASVSKPPTVADLDGDGKLEVLFTARHAPDHVTDYSQNHMAIFAVRQNPTTYRSELLWMRQPEWAHPMGGGQLVVADTDNDGEKEIYGWDWNTIGHRPGNWERLGPAHAFRLDPQGNDVWVREVDAWWSNKQVAVVAATGDQPAQVLVNGAGHGGDGIYRLNAQTGETVGFWSTGPWKMTGGPRIIDLGPSAGPHLIFRAEPLDEGVRRGAILVSPLSTPMVPMGIDGR